MTMPDYKTILLQLCASLTQVDHMGAAWEQVEKALKLAGISMAEPGGASAIAAALGNIGVTTFDGAVLNSAGYEPYY